MLLALLTRTAFACDPADLVRAIDAGEQAFAQNNPKGLTSATGAIRKALKCTTPTPEQSARSHRLVAYNAGLTRDWTKAQEAWRASLASHPLLPAQEALWYHPRLHLAWVRAQEQGVEYSISSTRQPLAGVATPLVPNTTPLGGSTRGRQRGLRIVALGVGLVAGGLYVGAMVSRNGYNTNVRKRTGASDICLPGRGDRCNSAYVVTNALSIASVGTAVLGGTLLGVSFAK